MDDYFNNFVPDTDLDQSTVLQQTDQPDVAHASSDQLIHAFMRQDIEEKVTPYDVNPVVGNLLSVLRS